MPFTVTQAATQQKRSTHQNASYLHQRKSSPYWYVRKRIPDSLIGHPSLLTKCGKARKELTQSTGKLVKREAAVVASEILDRWEAEFLALSGRSPDPIADVRSSSSELVEQFDFSFAGKNSSVVSELFEYAVGIAQILYKVRRGLGHEIGQSYIMKNLGSLTLEEVDDLNNPITEEMLQQNFIEKACEVLGSSARARQFGHVIFQRAIAAENSALEGISLSTVLDSYLKLREEKGARKSALSDVRRVTELFAKSCLPNGMRTAQHIVSKENVREFVRVAQAEWPNYTTCTNNISALHTVFDHGIVHFDVPGNNPFKKAKSLVPRPKDGLRKAHKNRAYEELELTKMLPSLARFSEKARSYDAQMVFGCAVLALYSGMRIEEICQLKKSDIKFVDGIEVISLPHSKSSAGIRDIPLNRGCREAVSYFKTLPRIEGDAYLVPNLNEFDGRRSKKVSDYFGRWKKSFFDGDSHKRECTFHSFRSTVITALDRAEVSNENISLLVGHEDGRGTLAKRTYSAGRTIKSLVEPASRMDHGDDLFKLAQELLEKLKV
ncbi:tyrosine-type recombinase/integrase [Spongiibacter taiwanensis]|uniref:site-specific integrase n=1 Tax=Spongiibacter taiwanensis TaxID=1748242 RepID=UPI002035E13A|nr:site-specific integrase [Spongiibacter taiwanensis]USA44734.1 tyrosine-type recombinase/integrase [Spongiibacter taiwanensis]